MQATTPRMTRRLLSILLPTFAIAALAVFLIRLGPAGIFPGDFPPIEDLTIGGADLEPGKIELTLTNGGPSPVTVSQLLVDDAFWDFSIEPDKEIRRLRSATITLEYPWVEAEPVNLKIITATGVTFDHTIDVATASPKANGRFFLTFTALGIYIGLLPVLLGMMFLPMMRQISASWIRFLMALTVGILAFIGIETLAEAFDSSKLLPPAIGGVGLVAVGAITSFALISAASRRLKQKSSGDPRWTTALLVSAGIGLHNLGEGLAVGAAYRLGEIALGTFLVIGFALHNTTEGLGIVSILGRSRVSLMKLLMLGTIAGAPTILGGWIGGIFFSPTIAALFLAIAAGAIAEVIVDVLGAIEDESEGSSRSATVLLGIGAGVAVMFLTGLLVPA